MHRRPIGHHSGWAPSIAAWSGSTASSSATGCSRFPFAVRQKFAEDQGGYLAASVTYYAFFSIFPLLLVLVTLLGYALEGDPDLQRRVLDSALADFPVIGPQLRGQRPLADRQRGRRS